MGVHGCSYGDPRRHDLPITATGWSPNTNEPAELMPTIFAACSNRKRLAPAAGLRATELPNGPLDAIASEWRARLVQSEERMPAGELYCGRAFYEAAHAARALKSELFIVSAG